MNVKEVKSVYSGHIKAIADLVGESMDASLVISTRWCQSPDGYLNGSVFQSNEKSEVLLHDAVSNENDV